MTQSANNHRPRVSRTVDKISIQSREDRSILVKNTAPSSPIWQANQDVQDSGNALVQAGVGLTAGEKIAQQLAAQAEMARQEVVSLRIAWDERFNVYAGNAERYAQKPEDVTALGLLVLDEAEYTLGPPLRVAVRYDGKAGLIRIHVTCPPGRHTCRLEISPNPIAPGSFQELKGNGARRAVGGYPPGGYWVRAAMVDAKDQSDYAPPVFVTVK